MDANEPEYGIVLVTAGSPEEAEAIARTLVEHRLTACVTLLPVRSVYSWQGEVHADEEWQLIAKTELAQFPSLEAKIRELHSYEVPEIIALPIVAGSQPYLNWIGEQTHRSI
ncbi:MAG TPA: divalent-cation tolerance protein CutA [Oscillatoriales cyanobacterium M59_W2019_021]|nr:MAG: divalent-cation tolerance protein CutA [Cyanobacteria bacterium J055]HIK29747.1 divalent-cation tolerance protein CutA [Oscillatoriales cyanobacterium M4454_W2019_049]HIK52976.1 divalent-cation tolerance protein CutA [Oscillatoriales cyanobacterium M59_W2019_021]